MGGELRLDGAGLVVTFCDFWRGDKGNTLLSLRNGAGGAKDGEKFGAGAGGAEVGGGLTEEHLIDELVGAVAELVVDLGEGGVGGWGGSGAGSGIGRIGIGGVGSAGGRIGCGSVESVGGRIGIDGIII